MLATTSSSPSVANTLSACRCPAQTSERRPVPAPSSRTCFPLIRCNLSGAQRYVARCRQASQTRRPVVPRAARRLRASEMRIRGDGGGIERKEGMGEGGR